MDGYRYLQPDNATRSGRRCNGIVSYDTLGDARQPGARADLLRLRYYPPRRSPQRSSDKSSRRGRLRVQAFEDADAAPGAPNRARVITSYQKVEAAPPSAHVDSHKPHCMSVTVTSDARESKR